MPRESAVRVVRELADRGYNAEREAVTLLTGVSDTQAAIERALEAVPEDAVVVTESHVRDALESGGEHSQVHDTGTSGPADTGGESAGRDPSVSTGDETTNSHDTGGSVPVETKGVSGQSATTGPTGGVSADTESESTSADAETASPTTATQTPTASPDPQASNRTPTPPAVEGDIQSTGTGEYGDFVSVFRDRYEKLAGQLRGRVNHRPAGAIQEMPGGSETALIGMVDEVRSTASGHWILDLEDTSGTFPCLVMKDREFASEVHTLLCDEVVAVEGTVSDDNGDGDGILFVDSLYFPDVPRTYSPSTADRHVEAALISDVHVGSEEFRADAWQRFADWLHTEEAQSVEYLLIGGDMVEGVGVYPDQDEELEIIDIYDQYERFNEHLKDVPGDMEIVMIPGNHDAVRLAEPQPAFDEELRELMSAHDATISGNPSTVTIEGVDILMYHGVSLDELIAELPDDEASYENPHRAMQQLLRKRHVAPQYGGMTRIAPEAEDHLVIEETPDIFQTGHVHKLGYGKYHNVLTINSSCWQSQTDFQKSVNLVPDVGYAPIVDLQTLDLTVRQFV